MNTSVTLEDVLQENALFVDNSALESFTTCPRKWEMQYGLKRVTAAPAPALQFGSAVHAALAWRYTHDPHMTNFEGTQDAMFLELGKGLSDRHPLMDDYRNFDYGTRLLRAYNEVYGREPFRILSLKDKPIVEMPFALPLGAITRPDGSDLWIVYTGKIDLGIEENDGIWVMDHKTSSIVGDSFYAEMAMSPQQEGYNWAFWTVFGVLPVGFIINMIATRKESRTGKGIEFNRQRVYISQERLEEWQANTLGIVDELVWMLNRRHITMHKKNCISKYGRCAYYDVCSLPFNQRGIMLSSNLFQPNTWSPLNATSDHNPGN